MCEDSDKERWEHAEEKLRNPEKFQNSSGEFHETAAANISVL